MYGHVERPEHWIRHMDLLRDIQKETGGFTEFVPLSLIHSGGADVPARPRARRASGRDRASRSSRCTRSRGSSSGPTFRNIQCSWVKEGPKLAQVLLAAGANDLGGTLINESISTSAGAGYGQLVPPAELRRLVRDAGRVPAQPNTEYELLRVYEREDDDDDSPLDHVADAEARFGSYRAPRRVGDSSASSHPLRKASAPVCS